MGAGMGATGTGAGAKTGAGMALAAKTGAGAATGTATGAGAATATGPGATGTAMAPSVLATRLAAVVSTAGPGVTVAARMGRRPAGRASAARMVPGARPSWVAIAVGTGMSPEAGRGMGMMLLERISPSSLMAAMKAGTHTAVGDWMKPL